jgi:membrane protein DedA with SNARE-associated domain
LNGGLLGLVFLTFIENVFPPIPSELIMPFGGYLAKQGKMSFIGAVLAGSIGSTLGCLPLYYAGKTLGEKRIRTFFRNYGFWIGVDEKDFDKARSWFNRHQDTSVFICRVVPGVRSFIALPAGISKMPIAKFVAFTFAGSLLWTFLLVGAGYLLGDSFKAIDKFLGPVSRLIVGGFVAYFIFRGFSKWRERNSNKKNKGNKKARAQA